MREILFRGKRIDNGEWVYGYPYQATGLDSGKWLLTEVESNKIFSHTYLVDPETIGQYTGLIDKNGKKIFEGDIIAMPWNNEKVKDRMVVHYERGLFKAGSIPLCSFTGFKNPKHNCEIIGNIHDDRLEGDE